MTELVRGRSTEDALAIFEQFQGLVTGTEESESESKLSVFAGVRDYPTRVKCATLAWHTLKAAIEDADQPTTTE